MGLNVCDTYSEFKITANTSEGKLATAAVIAHDVPYVWVSVQSCPAGQRSVLKMAKVFSIAAVFLELVVEKTCVNAQEYFGHYWHI